MPGKRKSDVLRGDNKISHRPEDWEADHQRTGDHRCVSLAVLHAHVHDEDPPQWTLDAMADDATILWKQYYNDQNVRELTKVMALLLTGQAKTDRKACKRVVAELYGMEGTKPADDKAEYLLEKFHDVFGEVDGQPGKRDPATRTKKFPFRMKLTIGPTGDVLMTDFVKPSTSRKRGG